MYYIYKVEEVWYPIEKIVSKKDNHTEDYNMDSETIYNSGGHIPRVVPAPYENLIYVFTS